MTKKLKLDIETLEERIAPTHLGLLDPQPERILIPNPASPSANIDVVFAGGANHQPVIVVFLDPHAQDDLVIVAPHS